MIANDRLAWESSFTGELVVSVLGHVHFSATFGRAGNGHENPESLDIPGSREYGCCHEILNMSAKEKSVTKSSTCAQGDCPFPLPPAPLTCEQMLVCREALVTRTFRMSS